VSYTQGGASSYEGGIAAGGPLIDGTLGARLSVWYRRDGGYIDRIDPTTFALQDKNTNFDETVLYRLAAVWAPNDQWSVTPSIYYQDRYRNDVENYWPIYSNPGKNQFVSADPTQRSDPDRFYLASVKVEGNLGFAKLISNTSYDYTLSSTNFASARAGMTFGGWQASLFADNLFDSHTVTGYEFTIDPGDGNSRLERQFTFRPRTIGITVTYRN
jgi:hypothetical protein